MRKQKQYNPTSRARAAWALAMAMAITSIPGVIAGDSPGGYGTPGVASREISRRLENSQQAELLTAEGDRLLAEGDCEGAVSKYREALAVLPNAPATDAQRMVINERFCEAGICHARELAKEGSYDAARALLEEMLMPNHCPDNKAAKKLLTQLDDPDRFPPALTPQHTANVKEVTRLLYLGESYYLIGDYDKAETAFFDVLGVDRYNVAARQFLEKIERVRIDYYGAAYNHTRARMLRMVDMAWEVKAPVKGLPTGYDGERGDPAVSDLRAENSNALQTIIIPRIDFEDTTLAETVEFLRTRSREYDKRPGRTPDNRGVNILIRSPKAVAGEAVNYGEKGIPELKMNQVPLGEVLRYLCDLTGMRLKIEQFAVVLVPLSENDIDLYTRSFRVPPDFIPSEGGDGGGAAVEDPFAAGATGGAGITKRRNAREYLESLGVAFGEGASANFDGRSSTLTVRNTPQAMEFVEQIVEESFKRQPKQVTIETKFVEVQQRNGKELGFDWLLGPAVVNTGNGVVVAGGSAGNGAPVLGSDFPINTVGLDGTVSPVGNNPVTSGNRSGDFGVTRNAIDSILNTSISDVGADTKAPGVLAIAGLLTEPQFQVVIRALDQKKGTDLLSAPSVTTKSGMPAKIEIVREFIYPTEYDPPEIPNEVGTSSSVVISDPLNPLAPTTASTFPVTPATPTAFETRNVGVTLDVDPVVGASGFTIDLNLNPEVVEFEGFINYGSPITSGDVILTENRIEMPVFSARRVKTQVTVWDGQTVVIGGLIREDVQNIEDKVPVLGDLPLVGRLFKTKAEERFKRNLMMFVTARLIDPAGKPVNSFANDEITGGGIAPAIPMPEQMGGGMLLDTEPLPSL